MIEGNLEHELANGSLRLLKVDWLLAQDPGWTLRRQQDLPEEAFWSKGDACRLLREGRVAALSYKWLGVSEPDPERFHLDEVLAFFREGSRKQTALMWDFASLPQRNPALFDSEQTPMAHPDNERAAFMAAMNLPKDDPGRTYLGGKAYDGSRSKEETELFFLGLDVMANVYASPRVLVLQQKRTPSALDDERQRYGAKLPDTRLDLIPYAGKDCRSGWCTFESATAMLVSEGGGHAYELGVGMVPVKRGYLPSMRVMEELFMDDSTRFVGKGHKERVFNMYADLRAKLEEYNQERVPWIVRYFDRVWTKESKCCARFFWLFALPLLTTLMMIVFLILMIPREYVNEHGEVAENAGCGICLYLVRVYATIGLLGESFILLTSRIVRAHLAVRFGCGTRDSLEYRFRRTLFKPPYYKPSAVRYRRERPPADPPEGGTIYVPSCFLPTVHGSKASSKKVTPV